MKRIQCMIGAVSMLAGGALFFPLEPLSIAALAAPEPPPACASSEPLICYSGPPETLGVGACAAGQALCSLTGGGRAPCIGEILPEAENCATADIDESCDGQPSCTGETRFTRMFRTQETTYLDLAAVAFNARGDIIVAGQYAGFGRSLAMNFFSSSVDGGRDGFVARFDASGEDHSSPRNFFFRFGGFGEQTVMLATTDAEGNILVLGTSERGLDIELGDGRMLTREPEGYGYHFLAKLGPDGRLHWVQHIGSLNLLGFNGIAADRTGDVVVNGYSDSSILLDGERVEVHGQIVLRFSAEGQIVAVTSIPVSYESPALPVVVAPSGHAYVATTHRMGVSFSVAEVDRAGQVVRQTVFKEPSTGMSIGLRAMALDRDGALLLAGSGTFVWGQPDVGNGCFLAKLERTGEMRWVRRGVPCYEHLAVDGAGNVIGMGPAPEGPIEGATNVRGEGPWMIAKLDADLWPIWVVRFREITSAPVPYSERGVHRMAAASTGDVLFGTKFREQLDFGGVRLTSEGDDVMIARLSP